MVDKNIVRSKLNGGLWKGTFHKLFLFNLTEFDKVIVLDQDVLLRTNIEHWFEDYGSTTTTTTTDAGPCAMQAIQANDNIEWNSGVMIITPSTEIFEDMLRVLPKMTAYKKRDEPITNNDTVSDNMNSNYHDQGFLSAYFTHLNNTRRHKMCTLPTEAAALSSSLERDTFQYFVQHRLHIFETIHMTLHKPFRPNTAPRHPIICQLMYEWMESIQGIEQYGTSLQLKHNPLRNCPPPKNNI